MLLDQHDLFAEVGRAERGGVSAGACAQHDHFSVYVTFD
jgi:hypothetical protein